MAAEIRGLKGEQRKEIFLDAIDVLDKYIRIAFADITEYVSFGQREQQVIGMYEPLVDKETKRPIMETVNFVDLHDSSHIDGAIETEVKLGKNDIGIKLADKIKALDFLAKHSIYLAIENNDSRS
ncbi:terminase small subunit [Lysinibacillus agricola]|uniref:terminase small subunit n=1 Tax=Lysinibacillus agricola TaxID=2590012 RepID=UPI003C1CCBDC